MTASELKAILDTYDDDSEIALSVLFPGMDNWVVTSYDVTIGANGGNNDLLLKTTIYESDFDHPEILSSLRYHKIGTIE